MDCHFAIAGHGRLYACCNRHGLVQKKYKAVLTNKTRESKITLPLNNDVI